ncbi:LytTR family DNA-binding domain-containing protein [Ruminococcus sp. OA3]|uniref:LytR/AlgR family response regulator transcription factor n=1 Tax=Ruminococcus sp. OA3 TaxID=2914164 RepID=UPI001F065E33|nr:LytTR family DNA-binding domain-containing protein [Ruminococcus sp. OA3]MCH1981189.1 LytTR family DNA-binding domain-containing protein [Ruminococcus sp. OA3]
MMQIAICDDEKFYRDRIKALLDRYLGDRRLEFTITMFGSGKDFLQQSENLVKYDIVFMDINMDEMDGIDTAMRIRAFHSKTYIVFVTAFISYVLEGYKVDAVRYIIKDTLEAAVPECMDAVMHKMRLQQVSFPFMEGERKLYTDNILYVESRRHKSVFFYLESNIVNYQIYDKLDCIEQKLSVYGFLRIHKSYLVNMKHLQKLSNYTAVLDTGEVLPVPRLRYQGVKKAYVAYRGIV